jgi:hypothetical protein
VFGEWFILTLSGIVTIASLAAALADKSAQATAWRHIAEERRWNHDKRGEGPR